MLLTLRVNVLTVFYSLVARDGQTACYNKTITIEVNKENDTIILLYLWSFVEVCSLTLMGRTHNRGDGVGWGGVVVVVVGGELGGVGEWWEWRKALGFLSGLVLLVMFQLWQLISACSINRTRTLTFHYMTDFASARHSFSFTWHMHLVRWIFVELLVRQRICRYLQRNEFSWP